MSKSLIILPNFNRFQDAKIDKLIDTSPYYGQTKELIQLLLDIGVIVLNPNLIIFEFRTFFTNNKPRIVALLLGYMAEGIVVRECNNDPNKNRDLANIDRTLKEDFNPMIKLIKNIFYKPFLENPEHYTAIAQDLLKHNKTILICLIVLVTEIYVGLINTIQARGYSGGGAAT